MLYATDANKASSAGFPGGCLTLRSIRRIVVGAWITITSSYAVAVRAITTPYLALFSTDVGLEKAVAYDS